MSHWDVLSLYGLRLPYKSQSWYSFFGELCVLHHPLFHLSTIAFELGSDLSSFHSTMHLISKKKCFSNALGYTLVVLEVL